MRIVLLAWLLALTFPPPSWGQATSDILPRLCATSPFCIVGWVPISIGERHGRRYGPFTLDIVSDRYEYWADDRAAHMVTFLFSNVDGDSQVDYYPGAGVVPGMFLGDPAAVLRLELRRQSTGSTVGSYETSGGVQSPKLEFLVDLINLLPGEYAVTAIIRDGTGAERVRFERAFTKLAFAEPQPPFPDGGLSLTLPALSAGAPPVTSYPVTTGVPLPRGAVFDPSQLALYENDVRVPAQFTARARWQKEGSLKWVGLDFTARWNGTAPRSYRIVRFVRAPSPPAPATSLTLQSGNQVYVIDTGAVRFEIGRTRFTGIRRARLRRGGVLDAAPVIDGAGGPYIVGESGTLYAAALDPTPEVDVEDTGPQRVTIRARGWYTSAAGVRLCRYVTRLSAFAGQALIRIQHHTIVTYDTSSNTRIADAGFDVRTAGAWPTRFRAGVDGIMRGGFVPTIGHSVYLHQDKHDHVRLRSSIGTIAVDGTRADGWLAVDGAQAGVMVFLRDMFQRYPKEIEVTREAAHAVTSGTAPRLVVHFWPRHGHDAFTDAEELSRQNIHTLRWAHEGQHLDLKVPQKVLDALDRFHLDDGPDKGWDSTGGAGARGLARMSNAQGVAFGGTFVVEFSTARLPDQALAARAALHRQAPHALPPGDWNARSGVEERLSGRDPARFPAAERLLDLSFPRFHRYVVEDTGDFGMWTYGNVHNGFDPLRGVPPLHRVRQNSHYRNVYAAWLLYLRSGDPELLRWARATSDNYQDVGFIHHDKDGSDPRYGGIAGGINHIGFLPWREIAETNGDGHWGDISGPLLNYYLTGDGRAWDVVTEWGRAFARKGRIGTKPEDGSCATWAGYGALREDMTGLGELVRYYQATLEPQALVHVYEITRQLLELPWECIVDSGPFTVFHVQWFMRYWHQTRDPRVVTRMLAWQAAKGGSFTSSAFLYEATRDAGYLQALRPIFYDDARVLYDDPSDRFHGYSFVQRNASTPWLQEAPYFMRALTDAGLADAQGQRDPMAVLKRGSDVHSQSLARPSAGWSNASLSVLVRPEPDRAFKIVVGGLTGSLPGANGLSYLYAGPAPLAPEVWIEDVQPSPLFESERFGGDPSTFSKENSVTTGVVDDLYRWECVGYCPFRMPLSRYVDAPDDRPREALLLRRTLFLNGAAHPDYQWGGDRLLYYLRPVDATTVVNLEIEASDGDDEPLAVAPSYVRLEDGNGNVILETNLFYYGARRTSGVLVLNPAIHALPWRLYASSRHGPRLHLRDSPDELLLGLTPEDIDAVAAAVNR
jgi:hypothetical protein